ncbi:MAG: FUSC family protein [Candidatus Nanopelagicales bacterium]
MHDPGNLILRRALRVAIVLPLAYVAVRYGLDLPAGAPYAGFGTFVLLAFADFGGPTKDRARAYVLAGLAGLVAIAIGTAASNSFWASVIVTFVVCTTLAYSGVLRGYVAAATTSILLPFVIAVTAPGDLTALWPRLIGFGVAVVFALVGALVLWPVHIRSELRAAVSEVLAASANVVRALWPDVATGPAVDSDQAQRDLKDAEHRLHEKYGGQLLRPGSATSRDRALVLLIDELTRLRMFLLWRPDANNLKMPGDAALARTTADLLDVCTAALGQGGPPPDPLGMEEERDRHRQASERWASRELAEGNAPLVKSALDAGFQLRLVATVTELVAGDSRVAVGAPAAGYRPTTAGVALPTPHRSTWSTLSAQLSLSSPWLRNSLRSGLALTIAVAVAGLAELEHPFWVVLGTMTALRFDAIGTGRTAVQAIVGTTAGFVVGTGVLLLVGDYPVALWVLLPIVVFLSGYTPGAISLVVGQASFTVFVIVFYALVAGPSIKTGEIRVVDVGIGLLISLMVSALMWPRGVAARVRKTLAGSVHAATAYLVVAYDRLLLGQVAVAKAGTSRAAAYRAAALADETFDLALAQQGPEKLHANTWAAIANSANQLRTSSELIVFLAEADRSPIGCPAAADAMLTCAHLVQARLNSAIDRLAATDHDSTRSATVEPTSNEDSGTELTTMGDPFLRLREATAACMADWADRRNVGGDSSESVASPAGSSGRDGLGAAAISLVWAEDWILHLSWVADRADEIIDKRMADTMLVPTT